VFVGDEMQLEISFAVARDRLRQLAEAGALFGSSEDAYDRGTSGLQRVGVPRLSKLVRVQVRELAWTDRSVGLAVRWEATGPGGALFPVLDADIMLVPIGEQITILTLAGAYRPPSGAMGAALDRAILHRVASVTIRAFLAQVARRITGRPAASDQQAFVVSRNGRNLRSPVAACFRDLLLVRILAAGGGGAGGRRGSWLAVGPAPAARFQSVISRYADFRGG
jgi:ribosomal protein S14